MKNRCRSSLSFLRCSPLFPQQSPSMMVEGTPAATALGAWCAVAKANSIVAQQGGDLDAKYPLLATSHVAEVFSILGCGLILPIK